MQSRSLWLGFVVLGIAAVAACSEDGGGGGGAGGDGGAGGTTTTSSTTTSSTTTSTTSTTCDVDLENLLGTADLCAACAREMCCDEAQTFAAEPTYDNLTALMSCTTFAPSAKCTQECPGPFCAEDQTYLAMPLLEDCAACIDAACCGEFAACDALGSCRTCLPWNQFNPATCCDKPLFSAWDSCVDTQCAAECNQPVWYECGAGGTAGTGGTGGAGGN